MEQEVRLSLGMGMGAWRSRESQTLKADEHFAVMADARAGLLAPNVGPTTDTLWPRSARSIFPPKGGHARRAGCRRSLRWISWVLAWSRISSRRRLTPSTSRMPAAARSGQAPLPAVVGVHPGTAPG